MDPNRVIVFDTTLRDGEQSPGISLNATEKLEIAQQLARLGVDVIEAGFPIASPGDFQAVRAIAREVHGPVIAGLARAHAADIERAAEAVRDAERPRVHTFISTSDIHIEHQLQSTREDVLGQARAAVAHARSLVDDVEFSPMDATRADVEFTAEVAAGRDRRGRDHDQHPRHRRLHDADEYAAFLGRLYELVPGLHDVVLSVHCHDDLGLAVANSFAGLQAGARQVECAINGLGERAGNASLEEIVMLLRTREADIGLTTGINTREIARASRARLAPDRLRRAAQQGDRGPQRVPARVRHPPGRRAQGALDLRDHVRGLGRLRRHQLDRARQALRPPRAAVGADGPGLRRQRARRSTRRSSASRSSRTRRSRSPRWTSRRSSPTSSAPTSPPTRSSGSTSRPRRGARRTRRSRSSRPRARRVRGDFTGDGPIDAIFRAINSATRREARLREFRIDAVTGGQDALGEASVILELSGSTASGQGVSTDIIEAAALAYVRALSNVERKVVLAAEEPETRRRSSSPARPRSGEPAALRVAGGATARARGSGPSGPGRSPRGSPRRGRSCGPRRRGRVSAMPS